MPDPVIVEAGREELHLANKRMNRAKDHQILDLESEFNIVVLLSTFICFWFASH